MTTPFDSDTAPDDGVNSLPVEAQTLYTRLERDGADWQTSAAPGIARINQRLRERIVQLHAEHAPRGAVQLFEPPSASAGVYAPPSAPPASASPWAYAPPGEPPSARLSARPPRVAPVPPMPARQRGMRRWVTSLATVAVVVAFLATLMLNAAHRSGGASSSSPTTSATPTSATPTSAPTQKIGSWVDLQTLDYATVFSANEPPAIAPSDPRVVYETMAQGLQAHLPASMRVTTNGGATWRALATPVPANHIGDAGIAVSPLDPQTVFLWLIDTTPGDCPANRLEAIGEGAGQFCRMEFTSVDGGASWSATGLPLAGGSKPGLLTASINSGMAGPMQSGTTRAQGHRLFSGFLCTDFSCNRLVTSVDGGRSWTFADQALLANGAADVCDYTLSVSGATLYAVTSPVACDTAQAPLTLWRSSDAGATWAKVSQLATPNERGMLLTQNPATGATLLYMGMPRTLSLNKDSMGYIHPTLSGSPSDVRVSLDGGATWQNAPTAGIPAGHAAFLQLGLLAILHDGSVVIDVIPPSTAQPGDESNFNGSDLYAWKPGDVSWRKIASVPREIDSLLVTPSQSGTGETLYTILVDRNDAGHDTFVFLKQDVR